MEEILIYSIGKVEGSETFHVEVSDEESASEHEVMIHDDYYNKLTNGTITKEALLRKSFEFLLEREPKEAILNKFDLSLISKYFPEYEHTMREIV